MPFVLRGKTRASDTDAVLVYDVHTNSPVGIQHTAEHFRIHNGRITAIRLIFDAPPWQASMAARPEAAKAGHETPCQIRRDVGSVSLPSAGGVFQIRRIRSVLSNRGQPGSPLAAKALKALRSAADRSAKSGGISGPMRSAARGLWGVGCGESEGDIEAVAGL